MTRPAVVIAHMEGLRPFDGAALDRLDTAGQLLDREPLTSWDGDRADALLADAEIIVGHWGTPTITADVLARAPKLRLFAYAAGTIKWSVSDDAWDARSDLVVTSGASANAEPVAEYTLAMILLANKRVFPAVDLMRDRAAWAVPETAAPHGNWDKTIGLVSSSLIGRRVAERVPCVRDAGDERRRVSFARHHRLRRRRGVREPRAAHDQREPGHGGQSLPEESHRVAPSRRHSARHRSPCGSRSPRLRRARQ